MDQRSVLNLSGLLLGGSSRLTNIIRFSNSHRIKDESVAEHSFSTALYCLVIGSELRHNGLVIDVELAVKRALIHDIEESHSGDFIRSFKHSDPALSYQIELASEKFADKLFNELTTAPVAKTLWSMWKEAKNRTLEGMLVEFADFLSVVSYVLREAAMGNRSLINENAESMGAYAHKFDAERYEFMRSYVKAAQHLLFNEITA